MTFVYLHLRLVYLGLGKLTNAVSLIEQSNQESTFFGGAFRKQLDHFELE